jgi:hypothetical protein
MVGFETLWHTGDRSREGSPQLSQKGIAPGPRPFVMIGSMPGRQPGSCSESVTGTSPQPGDQPGRAECQRVAPEKVSWVVPSPGPSAHREASAGGAVHRS